MHSYLHLAPILVGSLACKQSSAPAQHPKTASPESEPAPASSIEELPPQDLMICVEAMTKEREQLGPERFDAMRTCMLRASTTDQVTACAPE